MPPRLKAAPKPVARRRGAAAGEAFGETLQPSARTVTPVARTVEPAPAAPITHAPPPGRLDSLAPQLKPSTGTVRGGSVGLKFKPKVTARKTKEERDAIAAKLEALATPAPYDYKPRGARGSRGSRGSRGRGRDGYSVHSLATASGPFALGSVGSGRRKEGAVERGSKFTKRRQSDPGAGKSGKKPGTKTEDGKEINYSSSDDSDDTRVDVELIGYLDEPEGNPKDDEGDQEMGDDKSWGAGAPLRVPRSQHLELKSSVNTDSSSKTDKGVKKGGSKVEFETSIKIKDEPIEDENIALADLDSPPLSPSTPKATKQDSELLGLQFKEEVEMEEQDRQAVLREMVGDFSGVKIDQVDAEMKSGIADPKKANMEVDNQIFCFQFPEILPQLVSPIKNEPKDLANPGPDETAAKSAPPPNTPTSLKQQKLSAKAQQALLESFPPPGIAGKLRIHKSGRISILWGSPGGQNSPIEFDVTRGSTMEFLQEVVIIKQNSPWGEQDVDERGKQKGAAFSLGQVKGKFIVCPDFSKLIGAEKSEKSEKKWDKGKGKMVDIIQA